MSAQTYRRAWAGILHLACAMVTLGLLAGCASTYPPAPHLATHSEHNYLIGPGDHVSIIVWRHPELSMSMPVRPDGKITAPLVEDLPAVGRDSTTLAREIEKALARYVADPVVTVVVTHFVGHFRGQIRVVGEVARPQALPYVQNMSLVDVMIQVGGITPLAAGNRASILRTAEGNKQFSVRIDDLLKKGDFGANVEMLPGDVLLIPKTSFY